MSLCKSEFDNRISNVKTPKIRINYSNCINFSEMGSVDGTLEYGLTLHAMTPTSRECLEAAHEEDPYTRGGRKRSQSHYNDSGQFHKVLY